LFAERGEQNPDFFVHLFALKQALKNPLTNLFKNSVANFINILRTAFILVGAISAKKTNNLTVFYAHLGCSLVKAAGKMLMKLTLRRDENSCQKSTL